MDNFFDLYFVRHGETEWNVKEILQGHTDIPLNQNGIRQALELKMNLANIPFTAIFCSDLKRAKATAEIIQQSRDIPLIQTTSLRERRMGPFEGQNVSIFNDLIVSLYSALTSLPKHEYLSYRYHPDTESLAEVYLRVVSFLKDQIPFYQGKTILVVTHHGIMRSILEHLEFVPGQKWAVNNCGYIHLTFKSQSFELKGGKGFVRKALI